MTTGAKRSSALAKIEFKQKGLENLQAFLFVKYGKPISSAYQILVLFQDPMGVWRDTQ